jgi:hypothetical protein
MYFSALQEAQDIFGVDFDFDEFQQFDEMEEEEDEVRSSDICHLYLSPVIVLPVT